MASVVFVFIFPIVVLALYIILMFIGAVAEAINVTRDKEKTTAQKIWAWILGPVIVAFIIIGCCIC